MAGREVFGKEELEEVQDVLKKGVLFRYGFDKEREGVFKVKQFEEEFARYINSKYALGVSSGSAALKVALEALNLPEGKEVLAPSFTFVATIESIEEAGLKPVLCEIDQSFNISPEDIKKKITKNTVAIMPVHMMGSAAEMDKITQIAKENNLYIIEDACQSTGASFNGKKVGTFGEFGAFSFDYVKVMTTGEGGMVVTDNEALYKQAEFYHDHGHPHLPGVGRGEERRERKGFNYRMNEIQGALGLAQLKKLDSVISRQRENKKAIKTEIQKLSGIEFRELPDEKGEIATFLTIFLENKEQAEKFKGVMKEEGISPAILNYWHFIANIEIAGGSFPASQSILERSVSLEIKTLMEPALIDRIIETFKKAAKAVI
ncbi:MAG TPA: DegT/DnrJ/EryC1/StrS family aminotransferase [bacterium]|nr:DegT/DnrJ/EryC1/StrS family aminotransferase [bacterium]HPP29966.1 DegT/DnrJ/EryC1/StrS family aminotransferase [bacterium]